MKIGGLTFTYTKATIMAAVGAAIAVAVSFGAHLTQNNIDSILTLVGLLAAAVSIGGGVASAGKIRAGGATNLKWHFTPAVVVAAVGAAIAVAVSFGLHLTQENIDSIMKLIGLVAGGIVVGGGVKTSAMLHMGIFPGQAPPKAKVP